MNDQPAAAHPLPFRIDPRQALKLVVYGLLLVNFVIYLRNDLELASHTIHDGWTLIDYTTAYATTLGLIAWFTLLLMFELETYALPDEAFTKARLRIMHGVRMICYLFIAHYLFAYSEYAIEVTRAEPMPDRTLCDFVDRDLSFAFNLEYTELTADNCNSLSSDSVYYLFEENTLITDRPGMQIERELAWIDLVEAITWLVILFLIELAVRLQDRGITRGRAIRATNLSRMLLYGILWSAAAYWIFRGHWIFAWDEALWILGFTAIGMNLSEWRDEIEEQEQAEAAP